MDRQCIARGGAPVKPATTIVEALGGDPRSGMCCCPAHDDRNPSLHVGVGSNGKILVHCFAGCGQDAVLDALRARGLWPVGGPTTGSASTRRRSDEERREFALRILADTRAHQGHELAAWLVKYFGPRGITTVPPTAMLGLPWGPDGWQGLLPEGLAMTFAVTDGREEIGAHVTWLVGSNPSALAAALAGIADPRLKEFIRARPGLSGVPELSGISPRDLFAERLVKRNREPVRQFFGPVSGGFIKLYDGDLPASAKLVIAEGVETALAAAQIAGGLPAIAALSAANLPKINPPTAAEYLVCADNDEAGLRGARALAYKLARAGGVVRLAIPPTPGTDWNDVLLGRK